MIHKLQKKLTVYCAVFITIIIAFLSAAYIYISYRDMLQSYNTVFLNDINNVYSHLVDSRIISYSEMAKYTVKGYQIYIDDHGTIFGYSASDSILDEADLVAEIEGLAKETYDFPSKKDINNPVTHIEFNYKDSLNNRFFASVGNIHLQSFEINAIILYPLNDIQDEIFHTCILFIGFSVFSIVILCIAAWFFIGKMLLPIELSKKAQTEFIASASHELRAPLTVIMSSISALEHSDKAEAKHHTSVALSECYRMSGLIKDLLNLAKADSHTWNMQFDNCYIEDILIECYSHFEELIYDKGLDFNIKFPQEQLPQYNLDRNRILQLLTILVDNALSYTEKGSITLKAFEKKHTLYISVIDTGIGIPDEEKERIFERFYSVDHSRSTKNHYGLGLSIAHEIIKAHNGQILVEDTPGGGTTFTISL